MALGDDQAEPLEITPARFDALYAELRAPLRTYLRHVAGGADGVDDLFQEAWIRILARPPRTDEPRAVRAYVFTIASRLATDTWRRERGIRRWLEPRRREKDREAFDNLVEEVPDPAPPPDVRAAARQAVERSLGSLHPRERALLWLAHVERYDHHEIAAIMGIRWRSVRVLVHRARRRAAAALEAPAPSKGDAP